MEHVLVRMHQAMLGNKHLLCLSGLQSHELMSCVHVCCGLAGALVADSLISDTGASPQKAKEPWVLSLSLSGNLM